MCFIASDGYLFQTLVAARQVKSNLSVDADVVVIRLATTKSVEGDRFAAVASQIGIRFVEGDPRVAGNLAPTFARLFLDIYLPEYDQFVYLDGDTQIRGDLSRLLTHPISDEFAAVRDPMIPIRQVKGPLRKKIDSWWDDSDMPQSVRLNYVNAGMFRVSADTLTLVRQRCLALMATRENPYKFLDQDLINLAVADRIKVLSARWNYPGFLLGTDTAKTVKPVVIHFMSNPRPWEAPYRPWGAEYFMPYAKFASDNPSVAQYWGRADPMTRVKYTGLQLLKVLTERRVWLSRRSHAVFRSWAAGALAED